MHVSLLVLTSFCFGADRLDPPPSPATSEVLAAAIADLNSNKYLDRQAAMQKLWAAGEAAIPQLEEALQHRNAEVRYRVQFVLENLESGITIDTPKSILRELSRFRSSSVEERRQAMRQLERLGRPRILLSLVQAETDSRLRDEWNHSLERRLIRAIVAGELSEVTDTLHRAAQDDQWRRHWAAFAVQTGHTDSELAMLTSSNRFEASESEFARSRVTMLRAKGELAEAVEAAKDVSDDLYVALLAENRDWSTLARHLAGRIGDDLQAPEIELETLALTAAYFQLAGYDQEAVRYLDALRARAKANAHEIQERRGSSSELVNRNWHLAKALLLNGQYDDAVEGLRQKHLSLAFDLLCEQQRYREAFATVGLPYPQGPNSQWFQEVAEQTSDDKEGHEPRFTIAQGVIRQLYNLGRRNEALQGFTILHEVVVQDRSTRRLRMLCDTAVKLSLRDRAIDIAATIIEKEGRNSALSNLYPNLSGMARVWWDYFRDTVDGETVPETLHRIEELLTAKKYADRADEFETLIVDAAARANLLVDGKRIDCWHELAETCVLQGRRDLAVPYYEKAASGSVSDAMKLADLHVSEGRWQDAARWYEKAWHFDRDKPLPLYLYGRALEQTGRNEEGKRLAELALLMPLANVDLRHELASGLKERNYREEAREQFDLLLRTGEPQNGRLVDAAKQVGNLIHVKDPMRAADCWQTMLLCCMKPTWGFVDQSGYVQIPHLVHKTRAVGLINAGKVDEAVREIWTSYRAAPANVELAEEFVPLLENASRLREADELFAASANRLRELSRDFPQCATFANNLAWLFARCNRELDEALVHAQRAIELDSEKVSYVDTLGEVHFRRGEIEQAIACAERCVESDPRNSHYQSQLRRFRDAQKAAGQSGP